MQKAATTGPPKESLPDNVVIGGRSKGGKKKGRARGGQPIDANALLTQVETNPKKNNK